MRPGRLQRVPYAESRESDASARRPDLQEFFLNDNRNMTTITESQVSSGTAPVSSLLFTGKGLWHRATPAAVARAERWDDASAGWGAWVDHLASRAEPQWPPELLGDRRSSLTWAMPDEAHRNETADLIHQLHRLQRGSSRRGKRGADQSLGALLRDWLSAVEPNQRDISYALACLAWCHALPRLASRVRATWWWELVSHLVQTASDAGALPVEDEPLASQLLGGELPLTLAYLMPEIMPCRELFGSGRHVLSQGLVDLLDGEGLPHCSDIDLLRPLLACWTRCAVLADLSSRPCWNKDAQNQYEWIVRQALRLTRKDGAAVMGTGGAGEWSSEFFTAALALGSDPDDRYVARLALPGGKPPARNRRKLPDAAEESEWAGFAVLRSDWSRSCEMFAVAYGGEDFRIELSSGDNLLLAGAWQTKLACDQRPLKRTSDWQQICWTSDKDGVYLELEAEFEDDFKIQRQMLLAREDRFLLLADAVFARRSADLDYRSTIPLAPQVSVAEADETREAWLERDAKRWLVLPLAIPEWKCDLRPGKLQEQGDGDLTLSQQARGRALFAPLFIDLNPRRCGKPFTWRQLTVAENLVSQSHDVAVGFRVQVGSKQWLVYRSLGANRSRSVLGKNLNSDFLTGRFVRGGTVDEIIEIE